MPIERELRQLWYTAEHYWGNAKAVYDPQTNGKLKCGEVAKFCDTSRQLSDDEKLTTFLIADISSAAVRLITIDERLYEDKGWRIKPRYSDNLNYKLPKDILASLLRKDIDIWIHQMLRDNAAHIESQITSQDAGKLSSLWKARQIVLEELMLSVIFNAMENVMKVYKKTLGDEKLI